MSRELVAVRNAAVPSRSYLELALTAVSAIMIATSLLNPSASHASSGKVFLETIGLSLAVGTVLGASTLPFYDQPGSHISNVEIGALAGALTGIGIGAYQKITGPSSEFEAQAQAEKRLASVSASRIQTPGTRQTLIYAPLVSLNW